MRRAGGVVGRKMLLEGWRTMLHSMLPEVWRYSDRPRRVVTYLMGCATELAWVVVMFLLCELLIWGIYAALRNVGIEFLSSIVGMVAVFLGMLLLSWLIPPSEMLYNKYVRSKVDFINQNLGVGFPVPMIMFTNKEDMGRIGAIFGNFFATGGVFWISILLISWAAMLPVLRTSPTKNQNTTEPEEGRPKEESKLSSSVTTSNRSERTLNKAQQSWPPSRAPTRTGTPLDSPTAKESDSVPSSAATSITAVELRPSPSQPTHLRSWTSALLTALCVLIIGLPTSYCANEDRPLDFSVLWLAWVVSVKAQATLRRLSIPRLPVGIRRVLATFLNPVLLTTFVMVAHTRIKAKMRDVPVETVLETFSSGTSLAQLWLGIPPDRSPAFGAGDAALSLLEAGIVVWGFKLHECRRQLFSLSGLSVVLVSILSAGFSAFVSVAMAQTMGIGGRESLSFASRSTTLALAEPSTTTLGGSEMINACLVVGNGIFGQLIAPWLLRGLRIRGSGADDTQSDGMEDQQRCSQDIDSAVEVATGATVGMNGAAMGVSFLYERGSRAAPYAALSMTAFGVATTVLASVEPFKEALRKMAGL